MKEYVFISYKSEQKDIAEKIKGILEENGISCWMAPESIPGGSSYASEITLAIGQCKEFVLILSALAQESQHIAKELDLAIKRRKNILPFVIDEFKYNDKMEYYLTDVQAYPAYCSWEGALEKLVREIRWNFDSVQAGKTPDTILNDPVKIGASLPHVLEQGYLLFGRYRIIELLKVYEGNQQHYAALDLHTERRVLVNYIDRTLSYKELYFGVSAIGAFFQHPYIASAIDEYSNESYFVHIEPFYEVESLGQIISTKGTQTWEEVLKWAIAVCHAMTYLNEDMGYAYCQMTPNNIRIQKNGLPVLFDMSVAIPLQEPVRIMAIDFCPMEVLSSNYRATPTVDIYALGANMYYALTGEYYSSLDGKMANGFYNLPAGIKRVILRCLDTKPEKRYQDFRSLQYDLEHIEAVDCGKNKLSLLERVFKRKR